jgi:hypothetical protein
MGKERKDVDARRATLLRRMSAGASDCVEKVIRFQNDDAPKYLENLNKFEQESRRISISID